MQHGKIQVEYQKRRTFLIKVLPCSTVKVLAPRKASPLLIEEILLKRQDWINKRRSFFESCTLLMKPVSPAEKRLYIEEAEILFNRRLDSMLPSLDGYHSKTVTLHQRFMRTQWGSCSNKGRVCLNILLIKTPPECIDFVIMHELCHLAVMNHSSKFYKLLNHLMPDWKTRQALLKKYVCV